MEIAPIAGVRAISSQRQPKTASPSQPQFKIDASERTEDDTYSPDRQHAEDTLEQENSIDEADGTETRASAAEGPEESTINVIV